MDSNEREQLAKRAHLDGKTFYDEFGHGLDEIGLGSILVVTVLVSSVIPFGSFQDTTPVLAFYLLIFGIVAWLFIRWVGRPFLYRLIGRVTPRRDFAAYCVVYVVTGVITLAAQRVQDSTWLLPQVPVWGSYFTLLFAFLAVKHNSTLHAVYALLSAWVGFFLAPGSSPVALFFLLVGSVLFLAGVIHFATFILVQRANSRRS